MAVWQARNKRLPSLREIQASAEAAEHRNEIEAKNLRARQRMKDAEIEKEKKREKEEFQKKIKRVRDSEIL